MASAIPKRPNDRGIEKPTHATRLEFYYIHMVVHKYTIPIYTAYRIVIIAPFGMREV